MTDNIEDTIKRLLLPSYVAGPAIKWREDEYGLHLIQATVPGYTFERVMEALGVSVVEIKRLDDIEHQKFREWCEVERRRSRA